MINVLKLHLVHLRKLSHWRFSKSLLNGIVVATFRGPSLSSALNRVFYLLSIPHVYMTSRWLNSFFLKILFAQEIGIIDSSETSIKICFVCKKIKFGFFLYYFLWTLVESRIYKTNKVCISANSIRLSSAIKF